MHFRQIPPRLRGDRWRYNSHKTPPLAPETVVLPGLPGKLALHQVHQQRGRAPAQVRLPPVVSSCISHARSRTVSGRAARFIRACYPDTVRDNAY